MDVPTLFKNSRKLILDILEKHPVTRGNDLELILKVWEYQGLHLTPQQLYLIHKVYTPETIRRTRQKIQEEGYFPAPKIVQEQRSLLEDSYREEMRK